MPKLYVLSGDDVGHTYEVAGDAAVLGRGKDADLVVRGASVSRNHARLERRPGGWHLTDLGSSNGVRVGGRRVREADLADGQTFHLGEIEMRFRSSEGPASAPSSPAPEASFEERSAETAYVPPAPAPPATSVTPDAGLELEGDWDEDAGLAIEPVRSAPAPPAPPAPKAPPAADASAGETSARRARAMGAGAGAGAGGLRKTTGGGRILQYQHKDNREGLLGGDVGQQTAGTRWLLYALVVALFLGLAYGAYTLTSSAKRNAALLEDDGQ